MRFWRLALVFALTATIVVGFYWAYLYRSLTTTFDQAQERVPTQIFSDVTRLHPGITRQATERKLLALGYTPTPDAADKNILTFRVHAFSFPQYLIPDEHPSWNYQNQEVKLGFTDRALSTLEVGGSRVEELYLEPELVARLSQSGDANVRDLIALEEVPSALWKAILSVEDAHFLDHQGVDPRGLARAMWVNLKTFSFAQGGSTITQQLVKNLMARRGKNPFKKLNELILAFLLEFNKSKEEILERYLNEVYLGQIGSLEIHGVAEGAKYFFGKNLKTLSLAEAAVIAAVVRGPFFYSPYQHPDRTIERQRFVLKRMVETGALDPDEAEEASQQALHFAPAETSGNKAPYFVDVVKSELLRTLGDKLSETEINDSGFRVYTTLDRDLNDLAQKAVADGIAALSNPDLEGILAAVEHRTGRVRALIGGQSYAKSTFNRILNMKRQAGSTFKPIVMLAALLKGESSTGAPFGPGMPLEDAPWRLTYNHGKLKWAPKNYDSHYQGWVSMRTALSQSLNVPTARLALDVGLDEIVRIAQGLGIKSDLPAVPSLALGSPEVEPLELLHVYATLANHGMRGERMEIVRAVVDADGHDYRRFSEIQTQVLSSVHVDWLTEMLQDVLTVGTARRARTELGLTVPAAGKTGTTSEYRDAWFAGYTTSLAAIAWVGADQGLTPGKLTGAGAALPIWTRFVQAASQLYPAEVFPVNDQISQIRIDRHSGYLAEEHCPSDQVTVEPYPLEQSPRKELCRVQWPESVSESTTQ